MKKIEDAIMDSISKIDPKSNLPKDRGIISKMSKEFQKTKGLNPKKDLNVSKLKKAFPSKKDGFIYMMEYIPPDRKEKVFFDRFPIILILGFMGNRFLGVNLHLLPLRERIILLFFMVKNTRKMQNNYARVKMATLLSNKVILKYILEAKDIFYTTGIRSKIRPIEVEEMIESVFLPVEKFVGMSKLKVHSMMRKRLRKK